MPRECSNYKEMSKYEFTKYNVHKCMPGARGGHTTISQWLQSCFCSPRLAVAVKKPESALVRLWLHHIQSFLEVSLTNLLDCNVLVHGAQSCLLTKGHHLNTERNNTVKILESTHT